MSQSDSGSTAGAPRAARATFTPAYSSFVLAVLVLGYVVNVSDRAVLSVLIESIKHEFGTSDTLLGLLGGIAFALFYATLGIPIAAWADRSSRRNVLALCVTLWTVMTMMCGLATTFWWLLLARIGTAIGEAGGTPPSHSLISDYFSLRQRATALSIYALGVPIGAMVGSYAGGWLNEFYGWRHAFILVALPGLLVALLIRLTVAEPSRGHSDLVTAPVSGAAAPRVTQALGYLWSLRSFRHVCLAAGLHSFVWYAGSTWNAPFFMRSHGLTSGQVGSWLAIIAAIGAVGTFTGGILADRLSVLRGDRRWYMWVPGYATLAMVPLQFISYLAPEMSLVIPSFSAMTVLASFFFGPSFAMAQSLATLRTRAIATSLMLFVQTLIGLGLGPFFVGVISDQLRPTQGSQSLAYGLVIVGLVNLWAAAHYFRGARTLREDLATTERLARRAAEG